MKKIKLLLVPVSMLVFSQQRDTLILKEDTEKFQKFILKDGTVRIYSKPRLFDFVTKAPRNFVETNKNFVAGDHAWYLAGTVAATAFFVTADQNLTDHSRIFADKLGMDKDNTYRTAAGFIKVPQNIGAALYLVGNGSTSVLLGIGFASYGLINNDYRAQATASGLVESLILSGVFSQTIKRVTGRESPSAAIENNHPGGHWNPFPSFSAFAKNTPLYDAMPSGHLTTFMSALTVIADNYPDVKWIKPVGYTLAGAMSFQMMQSRLHWFSDYPLALFMGYFIGKTISKSRYTVFNEKNGRAAYKMDFTASQSMGYRMVGVKLSF